MTRAPLDKDEYSASKSNDNATHRNTALCRAHLTLARPAGSACNDAVGIDRVALMFLTLGQLPQDAAWAAWLEGASGSCLCSFTRQEQL